MITVLPLKLEKIKINQIDYAQAAYYWCHNSESVNLFLRIACSVVVGRSKEVAKGAVPLPLPPSLAPHK